MSLYHYDISKDIASRDYPFYGIIMAAMRGADSHNLEKLRAAWPEVYDEFKSRYWAPGGVLDGDEAWEVDESRGRAR